MGSRRFHQNFHRKPPAKSGRLKQDDGGEPAATIEIDYVAPPKGTTDRTMKIDFTTLGDDGQPLGNVWVGVFPTKRIVGAPTSGYHLWSNAAGKIAMSGMPTGKYVVKVGAEIFGTTTLADGTLAYTSH